MRIRIVSSVLAACLLVVLSVGFAGSATTASFRVTVPFAFRAGNASFHEGSYTISESPMQGCLLIRNNQDGRSSFVVTYPGKSTHNAGNAGLVFHRYADQYFLSQVTNGIDQDSRRLPVSQLEKDFVGTARAAAQNAAQPDVFIMASR